MSSCAIDTSIFSLLREPWARERRQTFESPSLCSQISAASLPPLPSRRGSSNRQYLLLEDHSDAELVVARLSGPIDSFDGWIIGLLTSNSSSRPPSASECSLSVPRTGNVVPIFPVCILPSTATSANFRQSLLRYPPGVTKMISAKDLAATLKSRLAISAFKS